MAEENIIDEMRAAIGRLSEPAVIEIEKGMIRKFVEAIEDSNPLWQDEEHARCARYGGIVAPPGLLMAAMMGGMGGERPMVTFPRPNIVDGGGEWEYFKPIRPGDVLTVVSKLHDIREREGRLGKMLFITNETTWRNQRNELVARALNTIINY